MNVVQSYPPNFEAIKAKFDPPITACYTYGDTIYSPSGNDITPDLMAHEETHQRQQGSDPDAWWDKYINDDAFRLEQEVEAYRKQYKKFLEMRKDRNERVRFLYSLARFLSGDMYNNVISLGEAVKLIKQ